MELVVLADDACLFMVAWELMSVASYLLVAFQREHAPNRRASFLYLVRAKVAIYGFVRLGFSEWQTFQTALQVSALDSGILRSCVPVAAAACVKADRPMTRFG